MKEQSRLVLAIAIASIGLGIAGYVYHRKAGSRDTNKMLPPTPIAEQRRALAASLVTEITPSADTVDGFVARAIEKVATSSLLRSAKIDRPDDLVDAFEEQLRATIDGNFDRRVKELNARGYKLDSASASERKRWEDAAERTRWSKFGLDQLKVEPVYIDGKRVKPDEITTHWSRTEFSKVPNENSLGRDIDGQRLTIVEVALPMETARVGTSDRVAGITLYRFAWNRETKQWVPWSIVVLRVDDHPALSPPF